MKLRIPLLVFLMSLMTAATYAQTFDLGAEIRPRFESRNGFRFLPAKGADAANFINQRARLTFGYAQDKLKLKISLNNHKVWGDIKTLGGNDVAISFHEAWGEAFLSDNFSVRFGRQEIIYDDQRIFGSVNWVQQARSHDAMVLKFAPNKNNKLDFGFALNANGESLARTPYDKQYKTFQYGWYHGQFDKFGVSFLLLNNGVEYDAGTTEVDLKIDYTQTIGTRLTYKAGKFMADGSFYLQGGKTNDVDVSASNYALNLKYKISPEFLIGAGYEVLSGNDYDGTTVDTDEINAFTPFYGTNHKFNGWMDHFYVGTWGNGIGLKDLNFVLAYKKDKFNAKIMPHFFSAAGDTGSIDSKLGTEIDFMMGYKVAKNISFSVGYSYMKGKDLLVERQGGGREDSGSVAYVQMVFNPKLFTFKKEKQ